MPVMPDLAEALLSLDRRIRFVAIFDEQTRATLGIDSRKAERFAMSGTHLRRLSRIIGKSRGYGPNSKRKYLSLSIRDNLVMLTVDESCPDSVIERAKAYLDEKLPVRNPITEKVGESEGREHVPVRVIRRRKTSELR